MRRTPWDLLRTILRRTNPAMGVDPPPDSELINRFARHRDETAFELLLWRHANLVLGVCRRVVPDEHLAEDAFQATFLILARKAGSIRRSTSLAGWLHRVARRVAVRAAKKRAVRIKHEAALDYNATAAEHSGPASDLRELIDAEIDRLPERYRLPVVLCYIEGLTTEDAARLLGIPRGTVLSRLATARGKLAASLTRHGVTLPATGLVSVGMGSSDGATYELIDGTLRATTAYAASDLGNTASVLLATEVLRMTVWKKTAGLVLAFVLTAGIGTGLGVVASELQVGTAPITHADKPKPVEPQKRVPASTNNLETDSGDSQRKESKAISQMLDGVEHRIQFLMQQMQDLDCANTIRLKILRTELERIETFFLYEAYSGRVRNDQESVKRLEDQRKWRNELIRQIAEAQAKEDKLQLIEDELRVYRELRQQLKRQHIFIELEKAGVKLPTGGLTQSTNDRLEQILREIEDLKSEVQRLRQARETTPKPTQRERE